MNTGIVTLLNYGKHVPPAVSHVTLAHEIGHNFGSPVILPVARYIYLYPILNYFIGVAQHDPENNRDCTPGGEDGNYIMFARATSGDKRNNNKFSPCSLKSINGVLSAKARNEQGCFTGNRQSTFCIVVPSYSFFLKKKSPKVQFAATEWWNRAKNAIVDGRKIARKSAVSPCAVSSSPERGLVL